MRKREMRMGIAAVLAGAVLFSPLVCGMSCLEARVSRASARAEFVHPAEEFVAGFAESAAVGCVLTHVVFYIDFSEWTDVLKDGDWVWVGVEVVELVQGVRRGEAPLK